MGMTKRGVDSGAAHPHGTTDATRGGGLLKHDHWGTDNGSQTLNDFQRLLGDISYLQPTIGEKTDEMSSLFKALDGDKDLNSSKELWAEAQWELALVEKKLQNAYVVAFYPLRISYRNTNVQQRYSLRMDHFTT